ILVVDDEPQILRFLRATLSGHGYEVTTAPDGETALAELHGRLPALVLLDLGLPGIDGLEVCRRLRRDPERPECRTLPIVTVSAARCAGPRTPKTRACCASTSTSCGARSSRTRHAPASSSPSRASATASAWTNPDGLGSGSSGAAARDPSPRVADWVVALQIA